MEKPSLFEACLDNKPKDGDALGISERLGTKDNNIWLLVFEINGVSKLPVEQLFELVPLRHNFVPF